MPTQPIKGYIGFDMDETLIQTSGLHGEYQEKILEKYGITDIKGSDIPRLFGSKSSRIRIAELLAERKIPFDPAILGEEVKGKNNYIRKKIQNKEVQLMPYADEAIHTLFADNYRLGIATGSERDIVEIFLDVYGLKNYISAIASCYDINPTTGERIQSKPSPEICNVLFCSLDQQFGHLPQDPNFKKYMIGDTTDDVICGQDAGATTVLVPNSRLTNTLQEAIQGLRQQNYHPIVIPTLENIHTIINTIL